MAKVFGPALSLDAKGKIGKAMVYQGRPKGSVAMKRPVPSRVSLDNPSAAKQTQRTIIKNLVLAWQALNENKREYWNAVAKELGLNLSGYHQFMKDGGLATMPFSRLLDYFPDLKNGLVGYWAFDEEGENVAKDYSGEGNNGILKPSYPSNCPSQVGSKNLKLDKALSFDAVDDYVDCGTSLSLTSAPYTASALVKMPPNVFGTVKSVLSLGVAGSYPCLSPQYWNSSRMLIYLGPNSYKYGNVDLGDNLWHYVVFMVVGDGQNDIGNAKMYVDAQEVSYGSVSHSGLPGLASGAARIGTGEFEGLIDQLMIHNRLLSEAEIIKINDLVS